MSPSLAGRFLTAELHGKLQTFHGSPSAYWIKSTILGAPSWFLHDLVPAWGLYLIGLLFIHYTWQLSFLPLNSFSASPSHRLCLKKKKCMYFENPFHTNSACQAHKTFPWNFSKQYWNNSLPFLCVFVVLSLSLSLTVRDIRATWVNIFTN